MGKWTIAVDKTRGIIHVTVSGQMNIDELKQMGTDVFARAGQEGLDKIFLDINDMEFRGKADELWKLPEFLIRIGRTPGIKTAIFLSRKSASKFDVDFYVDRALKKGFQVGLFEDRQKALDWLTGQGD